MAYLAQRYLFMAARPQVRKNMAGQSKRSWTDLDVRDKLMIRRLIATLIIILPVLACGSGSGYPKSDVRPLTPGCQAAPYVPEFIKMEKLYPGGERRGARAPDGVSSIALEDEGADSSCHSVLLRMSGGSARHILRV